MPTATVDDDATFFYEDSGAPAGNGTYTTLIVVHGLIYHGATFSRLVPCAMKQGVRLIRVNLRDYPGSSRYTATEMDALRSEDPDAQNRVLRAFGHQLAKFVAHIASTLTVPPIVSAGEKRDGGIVLLAWSLGNVMSLSMLANAESLPEETSTVLRRYLRTVVLYDAPFIIIGTKPAYKVEYHPMRDMSITIEERAKRFQGWISYYTEPVTDLSTLTPEGATARRFMHECYSADDPRFQTPTAARMTAAELDACTDLGVMQRSFAGIRIVKPEVFMANVQKALFNTGAVLPGVDALVVWCDMSTTEIVWTAKVLAEMDQAKSGEAVARRLRFAKLAGANHFAHWDCPERLMDLLVHELV